MLRLDFREADTLYNFYFFGFDSKKIEITFRLEKEPIKMGKIGENTQIISLLKVFFQIIIILNGGFFKVHYLVIRFFQI